MQLQMPLSQFEVKNNYQALIGIIP